MGAALVIALVKGLPNTVNTNGVFVVVVRDVAILAVLLDVVFVALSKGLVIAITLPLCPCTVVRPIPSPLHHALVFLVGCCMTKYRTAAI